MDGHLKSNHHDSTFIRSETLESLKLIPAFGDDRALWTTAHLFVGTHRFTCTGEWDLWSSL